jgi:hypothetical protein
MAAVEVCVPSFKRHVDSPAAVSVNAAAAAVEDMVVPVVGALKVVLAPE